MAPFRTIHCNFIIKECIHNLSFFSQVVHGNGFIFFVDLLLFAKSVGELEDLAPRLKEAHHRIEKLLQHKHDNAAERATYEAALEAREATIKEHDNEAMVQMQTSQAMEAQLRAAQRSSPMQECRCVAHRQTAPPAATIVHNGATRDWTGNLPPSGRRNTV